MPVLRATGGMLAVRKWVGGGWVGFGNGTTVVRSLLMGNTVHSRTPAMLTKNGFKNESGIESCKSQTSLMDRWTDDLHL